MPIDFLATSPQYRDHLQPVWDALPEGLRGTFHEAVPPWMAPLRHGRRRLVVPDPPDLAVVAAYGDLCRVAHRGPRMRLADGSVRHLAPRAPTVLFEHGVGFSFHGSSTHGSYAGGTERNAAVCLPVPNRWAQAPNTAAYPGTPSPIIGCPKLDELAALPAPRNERPVVAVSFHWDCQVAPETGWAWPHFQHAVAALAARTDIEVIGHAHPRAAAQLAVWWKIVGVEFVPTFREVCERADLYVNDSSSTLYEFAATGRPVVALNAPQYRRSVNHGLRFWDAVPGLQVDRPADLSDAVDEALADPWRDRRAAIIAEVYPHLGHSSRLAAELLAGLAEGASTP